MRISNKWYDRLKYIVTIVLPALTALWLSIASIWNLPYGEPIGATMSAITVFLGALIGISSVNYYRNQEAEDGDVQRN